MSQTCLSQAAAELVLDRDAEGRIRQMVPDLWSLWFGHSCPVLRGKSSWARLHRPFGFLSERMSHFMVLAQFFCVAQI